MLLVARDESAVKELPLLLRDVECALGALAAWRRGNLLKLWLFPAIYLPLLFDALDYVHLLVIDAIYEAILLRGKSIFLIRSFLMVQFDILWVVSVDDLVYLLLGVLVLHVRSVFPSVVLVRVLPVDVQELLVGEREGEGFGGDYLLYDAHRVGKVDRLFHCGLLLLNRNWRIVLWHSLNYLDAQLHTRIHQSAPGAQQLLDPSLNRIGTIIEKVGASVYILINLAQLSFLVGRARVHQGYVRVLISE